MLVLERRKDESIVIDGGLIKIMVVGMRGDKVRLGIEAPREISVHRNEIHDQIVEKTGQPKQVLRIAG